MKIVIRYILLLSVLSAILSLKHMPTKQRPVTKVDPAVPTSKNVTEIAKVENKQKEIASNATQFKVNQTAHYRNLNVTVPTRKENSTLLKQKIHKVSHKLLKNVTRKQENITEEKPKEETPKPEAPKEEAPKEEPKPETPKPAEPIKPEEKNTTTNTTKTEEEEEKNKHWWTKAWEWLFGKSKSGKENAVNNTTATNTTNTEEKPKEEPKKEETPRTEARKGNTLLKKRQ